MKSADVAKQLAMLPQMHDHQLDLTVKELIEFGRGPHKLWRGRLNKEDEEIVDWALSVTNLEGYEYRLYNLYQEGKTTRLIAMTLAQHVRMSYYWMSQQLFRYRSSVGSNGTCETTKRGIWHDNYNGFT